MSKKQKENKDKDKAKKASIKVETIPKDFYGGKNPEIFEKVNKSKKFKQLNPKKVDSKKTEIITPVSHVSHSIPKTNINLPSSNIAQNKSQPGVQSDRQFQKPKKSNKKGLVIGLIIFLLLVLGAITYYYFYLAAPITSVPQVGVTAPSPDISQDILESELVQENLVVTTTEDNTNQEQEQLNLNNTFEITFPQTLVSFSGDLDNDGLSDKEETIFQTDPGITDSDQDGYSDLVEIENLYNPTGFAPVKIIDSGLVKEYLNPIWKYRLYYPATWQASEVDDTADQVIFSSVDLQFIQISTSKKLESELFTQWFGRVAGSQNITELLRDKNIFDQEVYLRKDGLVAYIDSPEAVYVIVYKNDSNEPVEYKNLLKLMSQSFRIDKSIILEKITTSTPETPEISESVISTTTINTTTSTNATSTSTTNSTTSTTTSTIN